MDQINSPEVAGLIVQPLSQNNSQLEQLKKIGLYGAGLVSVSGVLATRYNQCLMLLGFEPTKLDSFSIDALGWSPEIAEEKGTPYYLCHGELSPYGIIISPEQEGKPIYFLYHSFDWKMADLIYTTYRHEIAEITEDGAICLEIDQDLHAFENPLDLCEYYNIQIGFMLIGDAARQKQEQLALLAKFDQDDNYLDTELHKQILGSMRKYGNLTNKVVELAPLSMEVESFHTRVFGGVFVLRLDPTAALIVIENEIVYKKLKKGPDAGVYHICNHSLLQFIEERNWIDLNIEYYREKEYRLPRMAEMLFAKALADANVSHSITTVLNSTPLRRKYQNELKDTKGMKEYRELKACVDAIEDASDELEITSPALKLAIYHPATHLPPTTTTLMWKLLGKISKLDPFYLYKYNKEEFYQTFAAWPESLQEWVANMILESNNRNSQSNN